MLVDRQDGTSVHHHNICIIGSGPVGIALALELARRGQAVTVLESGAHMASVEASQHSRAEIVGTPKHADMMVAVQRSFGGTSNLWGAGCVPLDPIDFERRPGLTDASWPLEYRDFASHFADASRYANCGPPVFEDEPPGVAIADREFRCSNLIRFAEPASFRTAHEDEIRRSQRIRLHLDATVTGMAFASDGRVASLLVRSRSGEVTTLKAKTFVVACGGVETARLMLAVQRTAPSAFGGVDGPLGRYYMGHLSGEIAQMRLANAALDAGLDFFRGAHGRYARRRIIASDDVQRRENLTNVSFWPFMPPFRDAAHRSAVLSLAYLALSVPAIGRRLVSEHLRERNSTPPAPIVPHLGNLVAGLPELLRFMPRFLHGRFLADTRLPGLHVRNAGRRYGVHYHAEHLPHAESRVTLANQHDELGMPRARIDMRVSDADVAPIVRTHQLLRDWVARTGLGELEWLYPEQDMPARVLAQAPDGVHQIGTARMGANSRTGVVDGDCRAFGSPNLYVAGSAVFPTSGQANPTFSAIALAVRLARHMAAEAHTHALAAE
ncbi:MAG: FAD-dependent oxidoreductase [Aquamicrobium sp.]|nr:FAD-dependent oxidoreductase [Aquamicrobium sp.]